MRTALWITITLLWLAYTPSSHAGYPDAIKAYLAKDFSKAQALLLPLADDGHSKAQFSLGLLYERGQGVPREATLAHMLYQLAENGGSKRASKQRQALELQMKPEAILQAKQMARAWKPGALAALKEKQVIAKMAQGGPFPSIPLPTMSRTPYIFHQAPTGPPFDAAQLDKGVPKPNRSGLPKIPAHNQPILDKQIYTTLPKVSDFSGYDLGSITPEQFLTQFEGERELNHQQLYYDKANRTWHEKAVWDAAHQKQQGVEDSANSNVPPFRGFKRHEGKKRLTLQQMIDGKINGPQLYWKRQDDQWALKEISHYKQGARHGPYLSFHENGTLKHHKNYDQKQTLGLAVSFNKQGQPTRVSNYVQHTEKKNRTYQDGYIYSMDEKQGWVKEVRLREKDRSVSSARYNKAGYLTSLELWHGGHQAGWVHYKDGWLTNYWLTFGQEHNNRVDQEYRHQNGKQILIKERHRVGKLTQTWSFRKQDGSLISLEEKQGKNKHGLKASWNDKGVLTALERWMDGKQMGQSLRFSQNGQLEHLWTYKEGKQFGPAIYIDPYNQLISWTNYGDNGYSGLSISYVPVNYEMGYRGESHCKHPKPQCKRVLAEVTTYNDQGQKHGPYVYYISSGKLIKKVTYMNGHKVSEEKY
ncbi:hypothetical protein [Magnetococcus sp. PR-3]|uniref:hypothetical protein n=1 Tax=Magnetococcus sp. PR-3 TaxID=3120355 RepID=UPI002FCE4DA6